jgi:hypothetical protein
MTLCFICQRLAYNFVFQKNFKSLELRLERLRVFCFRCSLTGLRGCADKHIRSDGVVRNSTQHFYLALRTGCVSPGQVNVYQWYDRYMPQCQAYELRQVDLRLAYSKESPTVTTSPSHADSRNCSHWHSWCHSQEAAR